MIQTLTPMVILILVPAPIKLYLNTGTPEAHQFEYQGYIEDVNGKDLLFNSSSQGLGQIVLLRGVLQ